MERWVRAWEWGWPRCSLVLLVTSRTSMVLSSFTVASRLCHSRCLCADERGGGRRGVDQVEVASHSGTLGGSKCDGKLGRAWERDWCVSHTHSETSVSIDCLQSFWQIQFWCYLSTTCANMTCPLPQAPANWVPSEVHASFSTVPLLGFSRLWDHWEGGRREKERREEGRGEEGKEEGGSEGGREEGRRGGERREKEEREERKGGRKEGRKERRKGERSCAQLWW